MAARILAMPLSTAPTSNEPWRELIKYQTKVLASQRRFLAAESKMLAAKMKLLEASEENLRIFKEKLASESLL